MNKFIKRSIQGIFIGAFITVVVMNSFIIFGGVEQFSGDSFVKNSLASLFSGWVLSISFLFFEMNRLSLWKKTAIHFPILLLLNIVFSYAGWIRDSSLLVTLLIFSGAYFMIWVGIYIYYFILAKKMNDELTKLY